MDLLGIMRAVEHARELVRFARGEALPDWASDEEAFLRYFGEPHEVYAEVVSRLTPEQAAVLDQTLAVNPEAAVMWVLSMEEVG